MYEQLLFILVFNIPEERVGVGVTMLPIDEVKTDKTLAGYIIIIYYLSLTTNLNCKNVRFNIVLLYMLIIINKLNPEHILNGV